MSSMTSEQGLGNDFRGGVGAGFRGPKVTPSKSRNVIGLDQLFSKRAQFNKMEKKSKRNISGPPGDGGNDK